MDMAFWEQRYMIQMLLRIRKTPGQTKTQLINEGWNDEGSMRTRFRRIADLIEAGYVQVAGLKPGAHNIMRMELTPRGLQAAALLEALSLVGPADESGWP